MRLKLDNPISSYGLSKLSPHNISPSNDNSMLTFLDSRNRWLTLGIDVIGEESREDILFVGKGGGGVGG